MRAGPREQPLQYRTAKLVAIAVVAWNVATIGTCDEWDMPKAGPRKAGEARQDNCVNTTLVWIPPGSFAMGSPIGERGRFDNERQVQATITKGFWLGRQEVSRGEWKKIMKTTPWSDHPFIKEGDDYPVSFVSWNEASKFCETLTRIERDAGRLPTKWIYTLPSEAQWEYACRAGTTSRCFFGESARELPEYAWSWETTGKVGRMGAQRVRQKKASPWGLYDIYGNVDEWCRDWYLNEPLGGRDPAGPKMGEFRVLRGGCWRDPAETCRSAFRGRLLPTLAGSTIGFRLAAAEAVAAGTKDSR
jgi:formylglycine-generating enzyme required for sulfatase activity